MSIVFVFAQAQDPAARVEQVAKTTEAGIWVILGLVCFGLFMVLFELVPGFIALMRGHPSALGIFALCFFLGWTGIAWVIALIWSLSSTETARTTVVIQDRPRRSRDDDYD